jgi:RNA polymerase sigma-70 factor (ECF subfamily)
VKAVVELAQDSDISLVATCLRGNRNAFAPLVERYQARIYNLCYRYTHNPEDARDLTQETFIRAFRALDRYKEAYAFRTWLYSIGSNVCRDWSRRSKHLPETATLIDEYDAADECADPADIAINTEDQSALAEAIATLPDAYKSLIILFYIEELSQEEISKILQLPITTIKNRLYRARLQLRQRLEEER